MSEKVATAEGLRKRFRDIPSDGREANQPFSIRVWRGISWLERSESLEDTDSRFIALWIAFNAIYGCVRDDGLNARDRETWQAFVTRIIQADKAGRDLGDAVVEAVAKAAPITADEFTLRTVQKIDLPSALLPPMEDLANVREQLEHIQSVEPSDENQDRLDPLAEAEDMVRRAVERGKARRLDVTAIMLGKEWILVALPDEMFCQYKLWVNEHAPFAHNMTLAYTNFGQGYIPDDASLALGAKGGYEAGKLPLWWACGALSEWLGPPEVGAEGIIKDAIASTWEEEE